MIDRILDLALRISLMRLLFDQRHNLLGRLAHLPLDIDQHFLGIDLHAEFFGRPVGQLGLGIKRLEILHQLRAIALVDLLDGRRLELLFHLVGRHLANLVLRQIHLKSAHRPR